MRCADCKHWQQYAHQHLAGQGECVVITGTSEGVYVAGQGLYEDTGALVTNAAFGCLKHQAKQTQEAPKDEPHGNWETCLTVCEGGDCRSLVATGYRLCLPCELKQLDAIKS